MKVLKCDYQNTEKKHEKEAENGEKMMEGVEGVVWCTLHRAFLVKSQVDSPSASTLAHHGNWFLRESG